MSVPAPDDYSSSPDDELATIGTRWHRAPFAEIAILLLASVIRLWRLDYHSIWFDEAVSLRWARSDAAWIWDKTFPLVEEKHPPGYYLFLHLWNAPLEALGLDHNDALLRASGVLLGVLTVLGVLLLVRRLSGRSVALLAGLLTALAPALVWYSQELRMFQPAATGVVWAAYLLYAAFAAERPWKRVALWLLFVATLVASLYTYLFVAFALPAAGLALVALYLAERPRRTRPFVEGVLALAIVGLLFLPLARNAWLVNGAEGTPTAPFAGFMNVLWTQLRVFTIWRPGWDELLETTAIAAAFVALLLGLTLPRKMPALDRLWLWLWIGVPLLVGGLLLATTGSVFGEDRYFLFLAPFALWAIARGTVALGESKKVWRRGSAWIMGIVIVASMGAALLPLWSPSHARENWRAAVNAITAEFAAQPDMRTAVISHIDYTRLPAEWYLRQQYSFDELPLYFPFGGALTADQIDSVVAPPLAGVEEAGFDTLWLLQSHLEGMDDGHLVESWLAERYPMITEQYPAGIRESAYAIRTVYDALPEGVQEIADAELAPGVRLAGCEITTPAVSSIDDAMHPPSGWVHARLWWQATKPLSADYRPQVRLSDGSGVWGEMLPRDGDAFSFYPTSTWQPGAFIRHEVDINLNPETPEGDYEVSVALLDAQDNAQSAPAICGQVRVNSR